MKNKAYGLRQIIKLILRSSPVYFIILLFNALIGSIQIYINLLIPKIVIDHLINTKEFKKNIYLVILIVVSNAILLLIDNLMKYILNINTPLIREKMKELMADKIMDLPYYKLEDSAFLDLKERAIFAINEQGALYNIIYNLTELIKGIAIVVSVLGIVFAFSGFFVVLLMGIIIFMFFLYIKYLNYQKKFYDNLNMINRREELYKEIAYDKKYSLDFRLYKIKHLLFKKYCWFMERCCVLMDDFNNNKGKFLASFSLLDNIIKVAAYGYVGVRRFTNLFGEYISIGDCVMYVNAVSNFSLRISKINENIVQIRQMLKYLEPYIDFMGFKDEKYEGLFKLEGNIEEICFQNVYFRYPGADKYALSNISFIIKQSDILAIAGKNGSGKSTIIKLLCKLYVPTAGKILVNGVDLLCYDTDSYLQGISAVFQDFKIFNYSVIKNIKFDMSYNTKVKDLINKMGLNKIVDKLPYGVDTSLGKEYDVGGVDLSGGEYQKIAIARAAYKDASVYIMDEPTSALDPIAESEIFEDMRAIVRNKTAVFVSHRMSSCKLCNYILVLEGGMLIEQGTHDELIKKAGVYADLYLTQAKSFN